MKLNKGDMAKTRTKAMMTMMTMMTKAMKITRIGDEVEKEIEVDAPSN